MICFLKRKIKLKPLKEVDNKLRQGFLGGLITGGLLMLAARALMNNQEMQTPARIVRKGRHMMQDMDMNDLVQRSGKAVRKTGRRILRTMAR
jgi:hypothetical protein